MLASRYVPEFTEIGWQQRRYITTGYNPAHPGTYSCLLVSSRLATRFREFVFFNIGGDTVGDPVLQAEFWQYFYDDLPDFWRNVPMP